MTIIFIYMVLWRIKQDAWPFCSLPWMRAPKLFIVLHHTSSQLIILSSSMLSYLHTKSCPSDKPILTVFIRSTQLTFSSSSFLLSPFSAQNLISSVHFTGCKLSPCGSQAKNMKSADCPCKRKGICRLEVKGSNHFYSCYAPLLITVK